MAYPLTQLFLIDIPERYFIGSIEGWENLPPKGPYILASNHDNSLDGYLLAPPIVRRYNQKVHFFSNPVNRGGLILGTLFKFLSWWWAESIIVDRSNRARSIEKAKKFLDKGEVVAIFPETIDADPVALARGKTGVVRLALASGALVVPVGMFGGPNMEGIRKTIQYFRTHPGVKQHIRIGKPLDFSEDSQKPLTYDVLAERTIQLMTEIAKLCGKEYPFTKEQWIAAHQSNY